MVIPPLEHGASLQIGVVEFVSPTEIKIGLDLDAPHGLAANAGVPRSFPRINAYVLIPTEIGYIVAQVEWITIERSPFPKRKGLADYGLVDLPFPLRKMKVNPLGMLKEEGNGFDFKRGVQSFPSVGEPVLIPTDKQLRSIIESGDKRRIKIGTSPLVASADVCIDPDRLFGRHLAVLGNTGSGKSCSIAGLIQWSLAAIKKNNKELATQNPNARFIILDPNGEYSKVFKTRGKVFQVGDKSHPLQVPLWFWNSAEWCSFTQASSGVQIPLLKRALRSMRNEKFELAGSDDIEIKNFLKIILILLKKDKSSGAPFDGFPRSKNFFEKVSKWHESIQGLNEKLDNSDERLTLLLSKMESYIKSRKSQKYPTYTATEQEISNIIDMLSNAFEVFGGNSFDLLLKSEDTPIKFPGSAFIDFLEALAKESNKESYMDFLLLRIRTMLGDIRMKSIIGDDIEISLEEWLESYLGKDKAGDGCVTIIDLSLVPTEVNSIITSTIARMIFEALQRYRKINGKSLPTVLVMEEAHTFIKRYKEDSENYNASSLCCQVFEKIAREGRKFGLGLVLSSQRPSELSPTVLSQCNSFLLHRISNDRDQELVQRLVPDNLRGLLRELPSLPSQQAILLGWATELPIMVRINELLKDERPHSDDPDFWDVWSYKEDRKINWKSIAEEWQMRKV